MVQNKLIHLIAIEKGIYAMQKVLEEFREEYKGCEDTYEYRWAVDDAVSAISEARKKMTELKRELYN